MRHLPTRLALIFALLAAACRTSDPSEDGDSAVLFGTWPVELGWIPPALPATHELWITSIEGARESLDLAFFYLSDDPQASGDRPSRLGPVVEAIERAAIRGVGVRLLADRGFEETYPELIQRLDAAPGIVARSLELPAELDGVHHAKYLVVDGRAVLTGSANFDWRSLEHVQELGLRIDSVAVASAYRDVFDLDWSLAGGEPPPAPRIGAGAFPVSVTDTSGGVTLVTPAFSPGPLLPTPDLWDLPGLVDLIDGAREELRLQALSFHLLEWDGSRFEELGDALDRAAERGVSIHLLVADWNKRASRVEELKELAARPGWHVSFLVVPEASGEFVPFSRVAHGKVVVADGRRALLGSSNLSRGYFHASRNAGLLLEGALPDRLAAIHRALEESPLAEPVDPEATYEPRRYRE